MKVFKFGGASVKDANAVRNMASIIRQHLDAPLVVIISAMGKTTNALEQLLAQTMDEGDISNILLEIKDFHQNIVDELGINHDEELSKSMHQVYEELENHLSKFSSSLGYDYIYDQTVSLGEILSTRIITAYMNHNDIAAHWLDARKVVKTDLVHRAARVDWGASQNFIRSHVRQLQKMAL